MYDYTETQYAGSVTSLAIRCPEHGPFQQLPYVHLRGAGCPVCARASQVERVTKNRQQWIDEFTEIHGRKYDYSTLPESMHSLTNVAIRCPEHGPFQQLPYVHLRGAGCPVCGLSLRVTQLIKGRDYYLTLFKDKHGERYDYSVFPAHVLSIVKAPINCRTHGRFMQTPSLHARGLGCPKCAEGLAVSGYKAWSKTVAGRKAILYLVRIYNDAEDFLKIGVTCISVKERFGNGSSLPYQFEQIGAHSFSDAGEASEAERGLHRALKLHKYIPTLHFSGHTECFTNTLEVISAFRAYAPPTGLE
ncbi:hypothetical protein [Hymenobacter lapidiphilus]|uniref:GIY-YIG nuclease family protein n=1 Tax=Hymenobacter lapidiphilus TaxID=2608003 RepID=A0A7Y7U776_9BACT|nr:hypothetical protein [Hymenobacter lapidiphilus]NVO33268.1 hypothetical protein [Hymenobacter lapidiphilus]